ncbi:MAG: aspartate--ammonia ligase [Clostridium sp.]|uniref:aspartate--ammonia ligase n=1 Tax=Clostridium culturomicium TaxID=1499683 RepID=UPI000590FC57|nr:aspartate--ammonia ligase [Clostridium culturomicium]MDU4892156.1 aspartate--ammonia ligase [Clostridium sp.]MDU7082543.1 aspartate--ammonia ligase [Clostridium sp.]
MNINGILIPQNYQSQSTLIQTEIHIKEIKDFFEKNLSEKLNLVRVSAPLFVEKSTGLNDNLNGTERPVSFDVLATGEDVEIVHSLAKWKRFSLHRYGFSTGTGLYTDMNAIRRDEEMDNLHSIYVDQWDWEKIIDKKDRTLETLMSIVNSIYEVFKETELFVNSSLIQTGHKLPKNITFITAQELEDKYPNLTPKEREDAACKEYGAIFLMQIGNTLKSGEKHDGRSPDYDDWNLNGDIIFWYPLLDRSIELSSMGIRVDAKALDKQLTTANADDRRSYPFHKAVLNDELPYTIGGGIGQSRICMYFLNKAHIGEVQASYWDEKNLETCKEFNIKLL